MIDRKPDFQVKAEIERIDEKLESTNKLLMNVLVLLDELVNKIDK